MDRSDKPSRHTPSAPRVTVVGRSFPESAAAPSPVGDQKRKVRRRRRTSPPDKRPPGEETPAQIITRAVATGACVVLALLAPFLGGGHRPWAWGTMAVLFGVYLVLLPPKRTPGGGLGWVMAALLAGLCAAFLPRWLQWQPFWRRELEEVFGLPTGPLITAQPWLTLDSILLFGMALAWVCVLLDPPWKPRKRHLVHLVFLGGLFILAEISLAGFFARSLPPFWENERFLGPFPNRNQMSALLAMAALLTLPPLAEDIRSRQPRLVLWLLCLGVFLSALVLNYSRAGLIMVAIGGIVWAALLSAAHRSHLPLTLAISCALLLGGLFLFLGGDTLKRFLPGAAAPAESVPNILGFRLDIYKDALRFVADQPLFGAGLGNFEPAFQFYREASAAPVRVIHPESDWFWMAAEAGLPWTLLFLFGLALLARRAFPLDQAHHRGFRLMALCASAVFVLHGLVDVSGHRLGSVFPALFVFSLALDPERGSRPENPRFSLGMRLAGIGMIAAGWLWLSPGQAAPILPGYAQWLALREEAGRQMQAGKHAAAFEAAERALVSAPLDWRLYYIRAVSGGHLGRPPREIADDFRRARALELFHPNVPLAEASFWASVDQPLRAAGAWREAARRSPEPLTKRHVEMYVQKAAASPEMRAVFRDLAGGERARLLDYLEIATEEEFRELLDGWLAEDPDLRGWSGPEKRKLLAAWRHKGDRAALRQAALQREDWLAECWEFMAEMSAGEGDYRQACLLAERFLEPPRLPPADTKTPVSELRKTYQINRGNLFSNYSFYERLARAGQDGEAFAVAESMAAYPGAPPYWHYLHARELGKRGQWQQAWEALRRYMAEAGRREGR